MRVSVQSLVAVALLASLVSGQDAPDVLDMLTRARGGNVPTPEAFLGYPLGSRYTSSADARRYAEEVARLSERVRVQRMGTTAGGRPLDLVVIADPKWHDEAWRRDHEERNRRLLDGEDIDPVADQPVGVWICMSVHGNEGSGVEAGMALLHALAADASSPAVLEILKNVIVYLELNANPDGRDRFVTGVLDRRSARAEVDPLAWDHREPWPGGRTNHYLFDLNRDWFLQTQPESRHRVLHYLRNLPHVLLDVHEMGTDRSYYFSAPPGPPVSGHVSAEVHAGWKLLGSRIAAFFDARAWPYWTGDVYPADYPGYGGAWPCLAGAVGFTFEQAGSRGGAVRRRDGTILTLREATERHAGACFAVLMQAAGSRGELVAGRIAHFERMREEGGEDALPTFIFTPRHDPDRLVRLAETLGRNGIRFRVLAEGATLDAEALSGGPRDARSFPAGSVVVSSRQPLRPLVLALLDPDTRVDEAFVAEEEKRLASGRDSRLYDVTAWNLPLMFAVEAWRAPALTRDLPWRSDGVVAGAWSEPVPAGARVVAWLLPGRRLDALAAASRLLEARVRVRVAPFAFTLEGRSYASGTLVVLADRNRDPKRRAALEAALKRDGALLVPVASSATNQGHDLGSSRTRPLSVPHTVVAAGDGTNAYSVGAVRWLLEEQVPVGHFLAANRQLPRALEKARTLVLPDGTYTSLDLGVVKGFLERGGTVVAMRGALRVLTDGKEPLLPLPRRPETPALGRIGGVLMEARIDEHHWITEGMGAVATFQCRASVFWETPKDKKVRVLASWSEGPRVLSGILLKGQGDAVAGKPLVVAMELGRGTLIAITEDVVVRGATPGLWRLVLHACLLGAVR